jgi:2'-5' RNA ligase
MKYLIVTLLKGDLEKFQQKLLYEIPRKFKAKRGILRKPPAHITLKYFFDCEDIEKVEIFVKGFCEANKKSSYSAKGFGHFRKEVIFIEMVPSREMIMIHKKFLKELEKKTNVEFSDVDSTPHFHSSVAHGDIKGEFKEIWSYVNKKNLEFECKFDNIAILKVEDNLLKIHKVYGLK